MIRWDASTDSIPSSDFQVALESPATRAGTLALLIWHHTGSEDQAAHLAGCIACALEMAELEELNEAAQREAEAAR